MPLPRRERAGRSQQQPDRPARAAEPAEEAAEEAAIRASLEAEIREPNNTETIGSVSHPGGTVEGMGESGENEEAVDGRVLTGRERADLEIERIIAKRGLTGEKADELRELHAATADFADSSHADTTRAQYGRLWDDFANNFCAGYGVAAPTADPDEAAEMVRLYLGWLSKRGKLRRTGTDAKGRRVYEPTGEPLHPGVLNQVKAAIADRYADAGLPDPTAARAVKNVTKNYRRQVRGDHHDNASAPVLLADVARIAAAAAAPPVEARMVLALRALVDAGVSQADLARVQGWHQITASAGTVKLVVQRNPTRPAVTVTVTDPAAVAAVAAYTRNADLTSPVWPGRPKDGTVRPMNRTTIGRTLDAADSVTDTELLDAIDGAVRDGCLVVWGWWWAMRASEAEALLWRHIRRIRRDGQVAGIELLVPWAKNDPTGKGHKVVVAAKPAEPIICPDAWLTRLEAVTCRRLGLPAGTDLTRHPATKDRGIFPAWDKGAPKREAAAVAAGKPVWGLASEGLSERLRAAAGQASVILEPLSWHGLRAGFVTEMLDRGAAPSRIAKHTRHRDVGSLQIYDRPRDPLAGGVTAGVSVDAGLDVDLDFPEADGDAVARALDDLGLG